MKELNSNDPLVTLIVPAHNSEHLLKRCLSSLVAQTYKNLEIIVVVNACKDGTEGVARLFADGDSRIRVICTDVPGVSHARNLALNSANGAYVGFADADDWAEPEMVDAMVSVAIDRDADVVCCGKITDTPNGSFVTSVADRVTKISADEFYYGVLMAPYCGSVWNKLFRVGRLSAAASTKQWRLSKIQRFAAIWQQTNYVSSRYRVVSIITFPMKAALPMIYPVL